MLQKKSHQQIKNWQTCFAVDHDLDPYFDLDPDLDHGQAPDLDLGVVRYDGELAELPQPPEELVQDRQDLETLELQSPECSCADTFAAPD